MEREEKKKAVPRAGRRNTPRGRLGIARKRHKPKKKKEEVPRREKTRSQSPVFEIEVIDLRASDRPEEPLEIAEVPTPTVSIRVTEAPPAVEEKKQTRSDAEAVRHVDDTATSSSAKMPEWLRRNLPDWLDFWPRARTFDPQSVEFVLVQADANGYADVRGIDWGAVRFCLDSPDAVHPDLPLVVQMQLPCRVVWLLGRADARERVSTLRKAHNDVATLLEHVLQHEDEWTEPPPLLATEMGKRILDERFVQMYHPDPLRSSLSSESLSTQAALRIKTRDAKPYSVWGPLYMTAQPFQVSPTLLIFHHVTETNLRVLGPAESLPELPFVLVTPVQEHASGNYGSVQVFYACTLDTLQTMTPAEGEAGKWLAQWRRYAMDRRRMPITTSCDSLRVGNSPTDKSRFARMLLDAPPIVVKTMKLPRNPNASISNQVPAVGAFSLVLRAMDCKLQCEPGPRLAASHAAVEFFQTTVAGGRAEMTMEGVHTDLQRFVGAFHPNHSPHSPFARPSTRKPRRTFTWFVLQAVTQLGLGLWNMRYGARFFHGDIKLDNAGVRFSGVDPLLLTFRWVDLDCASEQDGPNNLCTPINDPFSASSRRLTRRQHYRTDDILPTNDDLFFTDVFRFAFMVMLLWTGADPRHDYGEGSERPVSRSGRSRAPRRSAWAAADKGGDSDDERTEVAYPDTRTLVWNNLETLGLEPATAAPPDLIGIALEAHQLLAQVVQLQVHVRSRLQRFETLLASLETFVAREDVRAWVNGSSGKDVFFQAWQKQLPDAFHLYLYPQWSL